VLGKLADHYGIEFVYHVCSYLPLLGVFTAFLPDLGRKADPAVVPKNLTTEDTENKSFKY
jgi:FSR family fosmidomycin resistance protein-like MFS transporter